MIGFVVVMVSIHFLLSLLLLRIVARASLRLRSVERKERKTMSLASNILEKVTAQATTIASVVTLIEELRNSEVITPEAAQAILDQLDTNDAALEAALQPAPPAAP